MNYATIKKLDVANGKGIRVSLFVSGCPHHCTGCFNPETWNWGYGEPFTKETEKYIIELLKPDYIKGLSLLGGEPFAQGDALIPLLKRVKRRYPNKDVWCYTGYKYEDIKNNKMLRYIDVLVDGPFVLELKNPSLEFRGSSNQRIIYLKK